MEGLEISLKNNMTLTLQSLNLRCNSALPLYDHRALYGEPLCGYFPHSGRNTPDNGVSYGLSASSWRRR
jgi:hypothetical protein